MNKKKLKRIRKGKEVWRNYIIQQYKMDREYRQLVEQSNT